MADAPRIMLVEARFYEDIADELVRGAMQAFEKAGAEVTRIAVPGAFEIPAAINMALLAAEEGEGAEYDGFLALGCVIRGETSHYDIVAGESARALMDLSLSFGVPLANGILTVENADQAWARARVSEKNKGGDTARAVLDMIALRDRLGA